MEKAGLASSTHRKRSLCKNASSFRLRCESLNTLRLRRIFDLFDKNSDGIITVDELNRALNLLGLETDLSDLDFTVKSFIRQGNIGLQFEDFISLHQSLNDTYFGNGGDDEAAAEAGGKEEETKSILSQEESDLSEAFKVFDEDGDGYISAKELQMVLGKLGFSEGNEIDRVEKMIVSVDRNRDGRVDFFEFKDMMRSVLVRSS
jgi:calcium-binding protein CML